MSYTIVDTPDAYSSVHDDLIYTVLDDVKVADPDTYPNFKYIGDVYIGGTLVARLRQVQNPITGVGVFNVGQIVRNYVLAIFDPTPNALVSQQMGVNEFFLSVVMKFGVEYDFTSYYDQITDSARIFFNNYNTRQYGTSSSLTAYANDIASRRPHTGKIFLTTPYVFIPYFPTSTDPVAVDITPAGGSLVSTSFTPSAAYNMQVLNLAPPAINNIAPGTVNASTRFYTVQVGGQAFRFYLDCEAQYDTYALHFLNRYGGWETKRFTKVSRTSYSITKKEYAQLPYQITSSGFVTYKGDNGVYNPIRNVYSSQFKEKLTINTDLLTDEEYKWLLDLMVSPLVYLEDSGYFFPVVITETNYIENKVINDELTNLTISVEFGNTHNAQYR